MNLQYPQNAQPRRTFLSTLVFGASTVVVSLILSTAAVAIYGLNILDRKSDNLVELVTQGVRSLPELSKSLPPALADLVNDRRQPDYAAQLRVTAKLVEADGRRNSVRPVIAVVNTGDRLVSMLAVRVVVLDEDGTPISESVEYAATPVAADHDWRGPLMPGGQRHLRTHSVYVGDRARDARVEVELTDVRVWEPQDADPAALTSLADSSAI